MHLHRAAWCPHDTGDQANRTSRRRARPAAPHASGHEPGPAWQGAWRHLSAGADEKGQNRIGASRLQQIGKLLDIPVSYFFEGAPADVETAPLGLEDGGNTAYVADFVSTKEGQQLIRAFVRIEDVTVRKKILDLVEAMAPEAKAEKNGKKPRQGD
jgi:transcriptional regulator with XRE-family HTH domain